MPILRESQREVVLIHNPACKPTHDGGVNVVTKGDFFGQMPEAGVADGAVDVLALLLVG